MARYGVITRELKRDLKAIVGDRWVSSKGPDLDVYSRDMWPRLLLARRDGAAPDHQPDLVVWPGSERELVAVVKSARSADVPIVPYGGGSGVCGGVVPIHGGITIDVKRLGALHSVSRDEMLCDVGAGMNGERLERALHHRGYTLGHFPSSIYCSTVGGWLACRAAGQLSTKYGKIEDRVVGLSFVTGDGELVRTDNFARASSGPNWNQLIVGSEGTLGIITSARLRISPTPELQVFRGFEFDSTAEGVEAIRRVMRQGLRPAVVRLYDEIDTFLHSVSMFKSSPKNSTVALAPRADGGALPNLPGVDAARNEPVGRRWLAKLKSEVINHALGNPKLVNWIAGPAGGRVSRSGCRCIIGLEGPRTRTDIEARLVFRELEAAGARDLGEEPGRQWFTHRYSVAYGMSKVFREGAFVDTMEVASTWSNLLGVYDEVRAAIGKHAVVMAHFSHAYPEGCSIYFTFAAHGKDRADSERIYDSIWNEGLAAVSRAGGTISHHHGIGLLKSRHMADEHGEAMHLLEGLKSTLDPAYLFNPGKLGLEVDREP